MKVEREMQRSRWSGTRRPVAWAMAWLMGVGCSSAPTNPQTPVVVNNTVVVTIAEGPRAGEPPSTIDMDDDRIAVAFAAIESLVGHPVSFELESSLVPKFGERLHEAFVESLETLVTSLEYAARYSKHAAEFAAPRLRTVSYRYNPSKERVASELDVESGRLKVPVSASATRLLPDGAISEAFSDAWSAEKIRRYEKVAARDVPTKEHAAYLEFLTRGYRHPKGATALDKELRDVHELSSVLELYPLLPDPEVKESARRFLLNSGRSVRDWLTKGQQQAALLEPVRAVHERWIEWLNGEFVSLTDVQRREMANLLFTYHYAPAPGFGEGLDVVGIARPRVLSWLTRQKENRRNYDSEDGANDMIVCPYKYEPTYKRFDTPSQCNGLVYTTLMKSGDPAALVAMIRNVDAPAWTQTAVLNVLSNLGAEPTAKLIDALWQDQAHVRAALVAVAGFGGWGHRSNRRSELVALSPKPFIARIPTWWKTRDDYRPELLFLLVKLGDAYEGSVVWPKLAEYLGARLSGQEVAGYLRQTPDAIWHLRSLVRAVSDGWSRSKVLIPELERFLNEIQATKRGSEPSPYYVTERTIEFACITGTTQDVVAIQNFLRQRIEQYPSESRLLRSFVEASHTRLCPAARATVEKVEKDTKQTVFFAD